MSKQLRFGVGVFAGLLFGAGLVVGGMTQPSKIVGFLDFFGAWDPSLAFVMGGAVVVYGVGALFLRGREKALSGDRMETAPVVRFDVRLLGGSALFGVGWGLSGYCPGPALVSVSSFDGGLYVFLAGMLGAMVLYDRVLLPLRKS